MYLCSDGSCLCCGEVENLVNEEICEKCFKNQAASSAESSEISKITEKIFLGSYNGARNKQKLTSLGITHILICGNRIAPFFPEDFEYFVLPLEDTSEQELIPFLDQAIDFIGKAEKVFVHCIAGVSRSPSVVISYLMKNNGMSFHEAFSFVKSRRYETYPNPNFTQQLLDFEKNIIRE